MLTLSSSGLLLKVQLIQGQEVSHSSGHPLLNDVHAVNDFLPVYLFILIVKVALRLHLNHPKVLKFL